MLDLPNPASSSATTRPLSKTLLAWLRGETRRRDDPSRVSTVRRRLVSSSRYSRYNKTGQRSQLQQDAEHQENNVKYEHQYSEFSTHFPPGHDDTDHDEKKHGEEQEDGAEEAFRFDKDRTSQFNNASKQPGKR